MKPNTTSSKQLAPASITPASRRVYPCGIRVNRTRRSNQQIGAVAGESVKGAGLKFRVRRAFAPDTAGINPAARKGSVLIVVIGLLLLLLLIGLTFFTFANQEHSASEYYAESTKTYQDAVNSDAFFEFGLEQLIIGPHNDNTVSCLWPGRYSLVPNMIGMFGGNPNDLPLDPNNPGRRLHLTFPTIPTDKHVGNGGTGINVISGQYLSGANKGFPNGAPVVDQNFNGYDDTNTTTTLDPNPFADGYLLTNTNLSWAAQLSASPMTLNATLGAGSATRQGVYNHFPATDVGYVYPDINNMYLAHVSIEPKTGDLVVIPSFFRPGLMRDSNGLPLQRWHRDQGLASPQSETDSVTGLPIDTTTRSLQAHPGHMSLRWDADLNAYASVNNIPRYLMTDIAAGAANPYTGLPNPRNIPHFGSPGLPFYGTTDAMLNPLSRMGAYTDPTAPLNIDYWVDNDNDGILDGMWHDLGYPATTFVDGRKMIPLFSYLVLDADSLINLNTSGNTSRLASLARPLYGYAPGAASPNPYTSISNSNLGTSRSEINPFWALIADPRSTTYLAAPNTAVYGPNSVFQTNRGMFGLSNTNPSTTNGYNIDRFEAANMDMLFMYWGRPSYNVTLNGAQEVFAINNLAPGLWGEVGNLLTGLATGNPGSSPPNNITLFPAPGVTGYDDNGNLLAGLTDAAYTFNGNVIGGDPSIYHLPLPLQSPLGTTNRLYPSYATATAPFNSALTVPPYAQPLDFTGGGQWTTGLTMLGANSPYGMLPSLAQPNSNYPATYLHYNGYQGSFSATFPNPPLAPAYIPYQLAFTPPASPQIGLLSSNPNTAGVIDEADERVSDSMYANGADALFPVDETAPLQVDNQDYLASIGQSRLRSLMSFNLDQNLRAQYIRRHFTTESNDRRQHGFAASVNPNTSGGYTYNNLLGNRYWEYTSGNWDSTTPGANTQQFPPMVLTSSKNNGMDGLVPAVANNKYVGGNSAEPFRMELAALIGAKLNDPVTTFTQAIPASGPNNLSQPTPVTAAPYQYRSSQLASTPWQQQLRLNINRFLTAADPHSPFGTTLAQSQQNPLRYRELTPHPTTGQWNNLPNASQAITVSLSGSFETDSLNFASRPDLQEFWARRDRQQMARDIYVMLYMFGGGLESEDFNGNNALDPGEDLNGNKTLDHFVNYAAIANQPASSASQIRPLYEEWQLYEMAQFAVNIVDSLDRDSVITVFEFDMDLQDGWNLDDNAYGPGQETAPSAFPNAAAAVWRTTGDRGVVYGVEAQQLAFNEALVVVAPYVKKDPQGAVPDNTPVDHPATAWNDSLRDRTFTYLELSNVGTNDMALGNSNWQIMVLHPTLAATSPLNPPTANAWTLLTLASGTALAGRPYTIGSYSFDSADVATSGFAKPVSRFVVDPNWNSSVATNPDPAFQTPSSSQIIPGYDTNPLTAGFHALDLDLVFSFGTPAFTLTDGSYNPILPQGAFLDMTTPTPGATPGALTTVAGGLFFSTGNAQATFILRRRLNLDRPAPKIVAGSAGSNDELDNPWIEVDRINYWNQLPAADPVKNPMTGAPGVAVSTPQGGFFNLRSTSDSNLVSPNNAATMDIQPKLGRLQSRERRQPLDGFEGSTGGGGNNPPLVAPMPNTVPSSPTSTATFVVSGGSRVNFDSTGVLLGGGVAAGAPTVQFNTIGGTNAYTRAALSGVYTLWQPHFDRDFASVTDLFSIPLYGPSNVTPNIAPHNLAASNTLTSESPLPAAAGNTYMPLVSQSKILRPQYPSNIGAVRPAGPAYPKFDNRWHRVFELLEVPPRENLQVETTLLTQYPWLFPQALQRTPGKMNPNTMRTGENLFAALDDSTTFSLFNTTTQAPAYIPFGYNAMDGSYPDSFSVNDGIENGGRNWWKQLLYARDGLDPTTSAYLPGTPVSRPFRSLSHFDNAPFASINASFGRSSTDDTMLRTLPYDISNVPLLDKRGLFEARTISDLASKAQPQMNSIDYYTRQRLLSKISGNTTPRSNVFLVWMTVGFFEAYEAMPAVPAQSGVTNGKDAVLQIGAEMTDQPRHRGFFVVDRTLLEDAWVPPTAQNNNVGYYDFAKFVRYRKTLQ